MINKFSKIFQIIFFATVLAATTQAQTNWPSKPIKLVVPFAAGGATDNIARPLAQELLTQNKWQVLIENRPGAGANVGAELVAKSPPDGLTWLMTPVSSHGINPSLYAQSGTRLNFDPVKDFAPVSLVAEFPNVLVVNTAWAQKNNIATVQDLIR
jgi:tripartite-type tricarboxylate transporter receptor subunit TctC